jgi:hypothetical protein
VSLDLKLELPRARPAHNLLLTTASADGRTREIAVPVQRLLIAGWASRDKTAAEAHIRELEALGVPRPGKTPEFYHVGRSLLTTSPRIEVMGRGSTGEVECVLLRSGDDLLVGVGSDHTDRKAEVFGVTLAKQLCPKPIAPEIWTYRDVAEHWDELILRSWAVRGEERTLYQEGKVSLLIHPLELLELYSRQRGDEPGSGTVMFCGTVPANNSIYWSDRFCVELYDPVLDRSLAHEYEVHPLEVEDGA